MYYVKEEGDYFVTVSTSPFEGCRETPVEIPDFEPYYITCYHLIDGEAVLDEEKVKWYDLEQAENLRKEQAAKAADSLLMELNVANIAKSVDAETAIKLSPRFPIWRPGKYAQGDPVNDEHDYPWAARSDHDSTGQPDWSPGKAHSLWKPYHGVASDTALPWLDPALGAYMAGEWMIWRDGGRYRCTMDNTVWGPDVLPGSWRAE